MKAMAMAAGIQSVANTKCTFVCNRITHCKTIIAIDRCIFDARRVKDNGGYF
jgi:hypothetical protein